MRCHQCGYEMNDDAVFCSRCGAKIAQEGPDPITSQAYQAAASYYQPKATNRQAVVSEHVSSFSPEQRDDSGSEQLLEPRPADVDEQALLHARRLAYVRHDYDPRRDGYLRQVPPDTYGPPQNQAAAAGARPSATGMIVFSIINMVCLGLFVSLILGTIALVYAVTAASEPTPERAVSKLNTARVLNVIGLVFVIIQGIVFFVAVFGFILLSRSFIV